MQAPALYHAAKPAHLPVNPERALFSSFHGNWREIRILRDKQQAFGRALDAFDKQLVAKGNQKNLAVKGFQSDWCQPGLCPCPLSGAASTPHDIEQDAVFWRGRPIRLRKSRLKAKTKHPVFRHEGTPAPCAASTLGIISNEAMSMPGSFSVIFVFVENLANFGNCCWVAFAAQPAAKGYGLTPVASANFAVLPKIVPHLAQPFNRTFHKSFHNRHHTKMQRFSQYTNGFLS